MHIIKKVSERERNPTNGMIKEPECWRRVVPLKGCGGGGSETSTV